MAVKEADENDLLDDDDDNADAESTSSGKTDRKSKLSAESTAGRAQHKCSRKPTVSHYNDQASYCCNHTSHKHGDILTKSIERFRKKHSIN